MSAKEEIRARLRNAVVIYKLWEDQPIGAPPARSTIEPTIRAGDKMYLSLKIDLGIDRSSNLSLTQPIRINNKRVIIPGFPNDKRELNRFEVELLDVSEMLKPDTNKEKIKAEVEINYELGLQAKARTVTPLWEIGRLTMYVIVVPQILPNPIVDPHPVFDIKHCMFCGRPIPKDASYCPYQGVLLMSGAPETKNCVNCGETIPINAKFCERFGHSQP